MNNLKPCPHCGNDQISVVRGIKQGTRDVYIRCRICGCRTDAYHEKDEHMAVRIWNRRENPEEKVHCIKDDPEDLPAEATTVMVQTATRGIDTDCRLFNQWVRHPGDVVKWWRIQKPKGIM